MSKKLSKAQIAALQSAMKGNATAHLRGRSQWGGWMSTQDFMLKHGLLRRDNLEITQAGRDALASGRVPTA